MTDATEAKSIGKAPQLTPRRSLLKAKDDYQETLEVVGKTFVEDLPMFNGELVEFYEAVSDAEELGVNRPEKRVTIGTADSRKGMQGKGNRRNGR